MATADSVKKKKQNANEKKSQEWDIPQASQTQGRRPGRESEEIMSEAQSINAEAVEAHAEAADAAHVQAGVRELQESAQQRKNEFKGKANQTTPSNDDELHQFEQDSTTEQEFQLGFIGSEIVKEKFPKGFEVLESVVKDWTQDGDFQDVRISQPLANFYVGEGLRKAKQIEKEIENRLETAGILSIVKPLVKPNLDKLKELLKIKGL